MPKPAAVTGAMGKKYKQTWCPIWKVVDSLEKLCCGTLLTCRYACFLCPPSEAVRAGPPAEKNPLGLQHRHCAQVPRGQKGKRSLTAALCSVFTHLQRILYVFLFVCFFAGAQAWGQKRLKIYSAIIYQISMTYFFQCTNKYFSFSVNYKNHPYANQKGSQMNWCTHWYFLFQILLRSTNARI